MTNGTRCQEKAPPHRGAFSYSRLSPGDRHAFYTYWTGPNDNQVADVRWMHPILVNAADRDQARAVVIGVAPPSEP